MSECVQLKAGVHARFSSHGAVLALQCTLMLENGTTREDLKLPSGTDDYDKLAEQLVEEVKAEKDVLVTVLKIGKVYCRTGLQGLPHEVKGKSQ
eukprot:scaffold212112_cov14-Tisochrysis_lutea.AAC.2